MQPSALPRISPIFTLCLAAACAGLGFYAFSLRSDLAALHKELAAAQVEHKEVRQPAEVAREPSENAAGLPADRDEISHGKTAAPADSGPAPEAAPSAPNHAFDTFAQTFATPEMRQMVRREALNDARKGFADLLKKWKLPPAEADQFLEFVADRDSADASDALAMLATRKLDEKSSAEQEAKQEEMRQEHNARLKSLLGDERYADFLAADARAAEIKAVSSYRDHLEAAGTPLTDDQRSALAKIVKKETPDENDWRPEDVEFFTQGMTDAQMLKLQQRQEAAHARIAQQAASFLSPDQIAALQGAFRSELEEQDLALKMARTFFQNAAPPPAAK